MNILLNGYSGHMGQEIVKLCREGYRGAMLSAGVDPSASGDAPVPVYENLSMIPNGGDFDCIIDFSHHSCAPALLDYAVEYGIPTVVATTGHTPSEIEAIERASRTIPVFFSANMSLGIALLVELAKAAVAAMPEAEIEIIEKHHNRKLDAPSGTALMLANEICKVRPSAYTNLGRSGQGKRTPDEIGIHSVRMGNIVGEHEVIIGTPNQTVTLKHEAHSRALFAEGALAAADYIINLAPGLYDMKSMVSGERARDKAKA